jgi:hypothetical protein
MILKNFYWISDLFVFKKIPWLGSKPGIFLFLLFIFQRLLNISRLLHEPPDQGILKGEVSLHS